MQLIVWNKTDITSNKTLGSNKLYIYEDNISYSLVCKLMWTYAHLRFKTFFYDTSKQTKLIIHSITKLSSVFIISLSHSSTQICSTLESQKQPIITEPTFFAHYKFEVLSEMLAEIQVLWDVEL